MLEGLRRTIWIATPVAVPGAPRPTASRLHSHVGVATRVEPSPEVAGEAIAIDGQLLGAVIECLPADELDVLLRGAPTRRVASCWEEPGAARRRADHCLTP